ncbi:DUF1573 domain-containing protein [Riemerella columbipharyngis]|uniref:DUF1573 domain-containing protein n=1 Tax=Riemerella columbipharyngis TaxID=1071918 RepID=A0A1G7EU86_9FLAO|nr:DUF1573 domain-containing protein [Riemerella columbipharyngis]SDE67066.1 Protein of unknown function [Riemerella columbipharyngis]
MRKVSLKIGAVALCGAFALLSCEKSSKNTADSENSATHDSTQVGGVDGPLFSNMPTLEETQGDQNLVKQAQSKPLTMVALSEPNFDFGDVKSGSIVSHTFEISNTGKKPLIISEVKPGCGCTVSEFTKTPILPGKKGKITLKFNTSSFLGVQNKFALVYTNTEKTPITLSFTANIK